MAALTWRRVGEGMEKKSFKAASTWPLRPSATIWRSSGVLLLLLFLLLWRVVCCDVLKEEDGGVDREANSADDEGILREVQVLFCETKARDCDAMSANTPSRVARCFKECFLDMLREYTVCLGLLPCCHDRYGMVMEMAVCRNAEVEVHSQDLRQRKVCLTGKIF